MFKPADYVIDAFARRLEASHREAFGDRYPEHTQALSSTARMALSRIARSNALYSNLELAINVTQVSEEILKGKAIRDGNVDSHDWVHLLCAALLYLMGFVRKTCPGDEAYNCVIDEDGNTFQMPMGSTNAVLWPYYTTRAKIFIRHHFDKHPVLNKETLARYVDYTQFPPPADKPKDPGTYPSLLRAAQTIGAVGDPHFIRKAKPLYLELKESGVAATMGYNTVTDLRDTYPQVFWTILHPHIVVAIEYLKYTENGLWWLSHMYSHMLVHEHA